jgi:hypothetical protein
MHSHKQLNFHFAIVSCLILAACSPDKSELFNPETTFDSANQQGLVVMTLRADERAIDSPHIYFVHESAVGAGGFDGSDNFLVQVRSLRIFGRHEGDNYEIFPAKPGRYHLFAHALGGYKDLGPVQRSGGSIGKVFTPLEYAPGRLSFEVLPGKVTYAGNFVIDIPAPTETFDTTWDRAVVRWEGYKVSAMQRWLAGYPRINAEIIMNTKLGSPEMEYKE